MRIFTFQTYLKTTKYYTPHLLASLILYLYFFFRLKPQLYYQCQLEPFVFDSSFFNNFLSFPGGLTHYLSNLLTQFYYYPVLGAFIVTLILCANYFIGFNLFKKIAPTFSNLYFWALLPVLFSFMQFHQYEHRYLPTLAWIQALLGMNLYLTTSGKNTLYKIMFFITSVIILYYLAGGFVLLYGILVCLWEILYNRKPVLGILFLLFSFLIPVLAYKFVFIITLQNAYFTVLLTIYDYKPKLLPFFIVLYFPIVLCVLKIPLGEKYRSFLSLKSTKVSVIIFLVVLFFFSSLYSFDKSRQNVLKTDFYATNQQWNELLDFVEKNPADDVLVAFQTNRALFHSGRLLSDMFAFNQRWGNDGLFLPQKAREYFSMQTSDFYVDLGFINEAEHWMHEDHSNFVPSPLHLKRLAIISFLQDNIELAEMCLKALEKTVIGRKWVEQLGNYLNDPKLLVNQKRFQHFKVDINNDFITDIRKPENDLRAILNDNFNNKMAIEYSLAYFLLSFRLGQLTSFLHDNGYFNGTPLPRHIQEALIVYWSSTKKEITPVRRSAVFVQTLRDYNEFGRVLRNNGNDPEKSRGELKEKFGNTYWFYSLYNNPAVNKLTQH